jgi:hypothetical protein
MKLINEEGGRLHVFADVTLPGSCAWYLPKQIWVVSMWAARHNKQFCRECKWRQFCSQRYCNNTARRLWSSRGGVGQWVGMIREVESLGAPGAEQDETIIKDLDMVGRLVCLSQLKKQHQSQSKRNWHVEGVLEILSVSEGQEKNKIT